MSNSEHLGRSDAAARGARAEAILAELFRAEGWTVRRQPGGRDDVPRADLLVCRGDVSYAVEVKAATEGRIDRLVPLWAQACLQATRAAADHHAPLAVVAAPRIAPSAAKQVLKFASEYAPDAAAGVMDFAGLRLFRGPHLEGLDADAARPSPAPGDRAEPADLFSHLNQWMLKVLLAPELPEALLSAPRARYQNASQLARAANVSVMSAFRFVQHLQRDGHLHESAPSLTLVRRGELFRRWQAWAIVKPVKEAPMRFLLRSDPAVELRRILRSGIACLALFRAADALGLGFVHGVPPHVYVPRLRRASLADWKNLVPAERGQTPDVILRSAPAPQSVFRGVVRSDSGPASDVIQVWLDVTAHPSRGVEQAELIRRLVLAPVIEGSNPNG